MIRKTILAASAVSSALAQNTVYPFSLVPGGIHTGSDWKRHEGDFVYRSAGLSGEAHPAQLRRNVGRYVSFMAPTGEEWWTDHKLTVHRGEYVMYIGGEMAVRGRCGNRMRESPPTTRLTPYAPPETPETVTVALPPIGFPPIIVPVPPDEIPPSVSKPPETLPPAPPISPPETTLIPAPPFIQPPVFVPGPQFRPKSSGSGVAEIAVAGAPEPKTWVAMLLGLIGIGLIAKFRRMQ